MRSALLAAGALLIAACSGRTGAPRPRTDVPEPAVAPPATASPAGRLLAVGREPEGLVVDGPTHTLAVGVRKPDGVVLVDLAHGGAPVLVRLDGAPRHLQLAGAGGPLLAPAEGSDTLYQLSLPTGSVRASTRVGRQPHDAAGVAGGATMVGNELADTLSVVINGAQSRVVPAPLQPGGVAASLDGAVVLVVGVRGRMVEAYRPDGSSLGRAPAGVGPTHVRAGPTGDFYVADTQGDAVLIFKVGPRGPAQVGRVATGGTPYGLGVDVARSRVYVTLTASNQLRSFRIDGDRLIAERSWATARQPNDVAVVPDTGQVVVTGTADGVLEFIDP